MTNRTLDDRWRARTGPPTLQVRIGGSEREFMAQLPEDRWWSLDRLRARREVPQIDVVAWLASCAVDPLDVARLDVEPVVLRAAVEIIESTLRPDLVPPPGADTRLRDAWQERLSRETGAEL